MVTEHEDFERKTNLLHSASHRKRLIKRETRKELIEMHPAVHFTDTVCERNR